MHEERRSNHDSDRLPKYALELSVGRLVGLGIAHVIVSCPMNIPVNV